LRRDTTTTTATAGRPSRGPDGLDGVDEGRLRLAPRPLESRLPRRILDAPDPRTNLIQQPPDHHHALVQHLRLGRIAGIPAPPSPTFRQRREPSSKTSAARSAGARGTRPDACYERSPERTQSC
jgi:hypothetical protein